MARICEAIVMTAKGYAPKHGSWKFYMPDYLGEYNLQAIIDQADINMELAWEEYLLAQEANNGNQTTGS